MTVRRGVLAALAAAALAALAAGAALGFTPLFGGGGGEVPTARVERRDFVRRLPADGYLAAVRATRLAVPLEVERQARIAWLAEDGSRVAAGDPVVRFDPTEMEKALADARDDLATSQVKTAKERTAIDSQVANLGRDAELAERELETAERFAKRDETIFSRLEIIESGLDAELAAERRDHALDERAARRELGSTDLELLAIERRKADLEIDRARRGLTALEVTAPHAGIVSLATDWSGNPHRVGDSVWPGQALAEIPDLAEMQAEVWVLEADAGGLAAGQRAELWVEAHPETAHQAVVERVDSLAKPRVQGSPVQYFAAVLKLGATDPATMKPGQRVRAVIAAEARPDALVVPRQALFERDGATVVFRRRGGGFAPVPVEIGPMTAALAVVESGLEEGDEVALADPDRRAARREPEAAPAAPAAPGGLALPDGGGR